MKRFKLTNVTQDNAYFSYDEILNFGAFLREGHRTTNDSLFGEILETVDFSYIDDEIAIFINYQLFEEEDLLLLSMYNPKTNKLLFSGDYLEESYLSGPITEYLFQTNLDIIEDVVEFDYLMEEDEEINMYELGSSDLIKNSGINGEFKSDGTQRMAIISGTPVDITVSELLTFKLQKGDTILYFNENEEEDHIHIHCGLMIDDTFCNLYTTPDRRKVVINSRIKGKFTCMIKQESTNKIFCNVEDQDYLCALEDYVVDMGKRVKLLEDDI